jgi:hypothetical protein
MVGPAAWNTVGGRKSFVLPCASAPWGTGTGVITDSKPKAAAIDKRISFFMVPSSLSYFEVGARQTGAGRERLFAVVRTHKTLWVK